MAGLLFAISETAGEAGRLVKAGLQHMLHFPWLRSHQFISDHFAAICVLPDPVAPTLWHIESTGEFAAVFGEYYPGDEPLVDRQAAFKEIQSLCAQGREDSLKNRNGLYNLAFWNTRQRTLVIANDSTGALLLFGASLPHGRIWCSEPGVLFRLLPSPPLLNHAAIASLVQLGYQPDNRTLRKDVNVFPPATVLRMRVSSGGLKEQLHFNDSLLCEKAIRVDYDKDFPTLLHDAVRIRLRGELPIRLPLSGGEDSRLILGAALKQGTALSTFTLDSCQRGDATAARRVAALTGVNHTTIATESNVITDEISFLSAALASTTEWHIVAFLALLKSIGVGATIPLGFLGGTFSGAFVNASVKHSSSKNLSTLLSAAFDSGTGGADYDNPMFAGVVANSSDDSGRLLLESTEATGVRSEILWNLYRRQRKYASFLVRLAWNFGRPVCPFADPRLMRLGLSLNRGDLYLQRARRRVFRRQFPALAAVVNGNDGLAVNSFVLRRLKNKLRGTRGSALARRLLQLRSPNYDLERLRPLLCETLLRLPAKQRHLMESWTREASIRESFALLPLIICHHDSLDLEQQPPAVGGFMQ
jgi:hypothetical protein